MAVRTLLYSEIGGQDSLRGAFSQDSYERAVKPFWAQLNAIEPALWPLDETVTTRPLIPGRSRFVSAKCPR